MVYRIYSKDVCCRVLPHQQNTGGFFVALLEKNALCPWEAAAKSAALSVQKTAAANGDAAAAAEGDAAPEPTQPVKVFEPSQKKRKFFGFREDPFVYIQVVKLSGCVCVHPVCS
jgi:hypothetical protein